MYNSITLLTVIGAGAAATAILFGFDLAATEGASALGRGLAGGLGTTIGVLVAGYFGWFRNVG